MKVDYNKSLREVYINRFLQVAVSGLWVVFETWHSSDFRFTGELPSWVPNWNPQAGPNSPLIVLGDQRIAVSGQQIPKRGPFLVHRGQHTTTQSFT